MGMRDATVEDVRDALEKASHGVGDAARRQYVLRVKSLLGYAHKLGYTVFNAGVVVAHGVEGTFQVSRSRRVKEKQGVPLRDLDQKANIPEGVSL
jgi:hypothetical protein